MPLWPRQMQTMPCIICKRSQRHPWLAVLFGRHSITTGTAAQHHNRHSSNRSHRPGQPSASPLHQLDVWPSLTSLADRATTTGCCWSHAACTASGAFRAWLLIELVCHRQEDTAAIVGGRMVAASFHPAPRSHQITGHHCFAGRSLLCGTSLLCWEWVNWYNHLHFYTLDELNGLLHCGLYHHHLT